LPITGNSNIQPESVIVLNSMENLEIERNKLINSSTNNSINNLVTEYMRREDLAHINTSQSQQMNVCTTYTCIHVMYLVCYYKLL
jgi:hypothetical protein